MAERKVMRDLSLNEPITVTAPAYIWLALVAAYNDCDWSNGHMGDILMRAQRQILDPIYLRELEAAQQEQVDQHQMMFQRVLGSLPGSIPGDGDDQLQ